MKFMKKFWPLNSKWKFIIAIFIVWRLFLFGAEAIGFWLLPFKPSFPYADTVLVQTGLPQVIWQWANFDGVHYLMIAQNGYDGFGTQVFFPLYPLLINILTGITGNFLISGLLISNLSILLAAILLYRLTKNIWSVLFLFAFPTSLFFGSVYTESFFLLLILLTFSVSKWFGIAAGATRLVGIFSGPISWVGLAGYSLYLWWRFGQPLMFFSAQSAFGNSRATSFTSLISPFQVVYRYLNIFFTANSTNLDYWVALLEFGAFILGLGILFILTWRRKIPKAYLIYSWLAFIIPIFSGTFSSLPRYLLSIFSIFIGLSLIKNVRIKTGILLFFILLLGVLTAFFTRGYFVS